MRSSGERTHARLRLVYSYLSIVTARPLSPQEGARSRSPQLLNLPLRSKVVPRPIAVLYSYVARAPLITSRLRVTRPRVLLSWAGHAVSFIIACSHSVVHAESEAKGERQSKGKTVL